MTGWSELITRSLPVSVSLSTYLNFQMYEKRAGVRTLRNSRRNASESLEQRSHRLLDQCVTVWWWRRAEKVEGRTMIGLRRNCINVPGTMGQQAIIKMEQQPIKKPKSKLQPAIKVGIILGPCIPLIPSDMNIFSFSKENSSLKRNLSLLSHYHPISETFDEIFLYLPKPLANRHL